MRVTSISIHNIRSIAGSLSIELGPITLLVGRNNSGKSTILRALSAIQDGNVLTVNDLRYGTPSGWAKLSLAEINGVRHWNTSFGITDGNFEAHVGRTSSTVPMLFGADGSQRRIGTISASEPHAF